MGLWKASGPLEPLLRPLRVWGRYARAVYHRSRGRFVVFDRYVYEALLPASGPLLALKRPYFWLLARMIPPPTVVVVLDAPGVVTYGRKQENPPDELESE